MGLTPHDSTYFYRREVALKLLPKAAILVNPKRIGTCPEAELRGLQGWAFEVFRQSRKGMAVAVNTSLVAALSAKPGSGPESSGS
jgi:hypothetical protein